MTNTTPTDPPVVISLSVVYEDDSNGKVNAHLPQVPGAVDRGEDRRTARARCARYCATYLEPVEALSAVQAAEMADRLRFAAGIGLDGRKLRRLASRGLAMDDRAAAARAADVWLTTRRSQATTTSAAQR
jgi:hypothetical protein